MKRVASGLKMVAFKLSPTTLRRIEDIAYELSKQNTFPWYAGKVTKTDVIRHCVNTVFDRIDREAKKLVDIVGDNEAPAAKKVNKSPRKKKESKPCKTKAKK